jgi:hypothetical protein
MPAESENKSRVRSWVETVSFLSCPMKGRVLTSLVSFHDDGTVLSSDQGISLWHTPPHGIIPDW